jgi:hypothetical protein
VNSEGARVISSLSDSVACLQNSPIKWADVPYVSESGLRISVRSSLMNVTYYIVWCVSSFHQGYWHSNLRYHSAGDSLETGC